MTAADGQSWAEVRVAQTALGTAGCDLGDPALGSVSKFTSAEVAAPAAGVLAVTMEASNAPNTPWRLRRNGWRTR